MLNLHLFYFFTFDLTAPFVILFEFSDELTKFYFLGVIILSCSFLFITFKTLFNNNCFNLMTSFFLLHNKWIHLIIIDAYICPWYYSLSTLSSSLKFMKINNPIYGRNRTLHLKKSPKVCKKINESSWYDC